MSGLESAAHLVDPVFPQVPVRRRDLLLPDDAAAMHQGEHGGGFHSISRLATVRGSSACSGIVPALSLPASA
jgi:hypothetical protein